MSGGRMMSIPRWIRDDPRILNFESDTISKASLPERFALVENRKMRLYCGDGNHGKLSPAEITSRHQLGISGTNMLNLQQFTPEGWNIFCFSPTAGMETKIRDLNFAFLRDNPELNIIICLINLSNHVELTKLSDVFEDSIDAIDSDWRNAYIPELICWYLVKAGGICVLANSGEDIEDFISKPDRWTMNEPDRFKKGLLDLTFTKTSKKARGGMKKRRSRRKYKKNKKTKRRTN